MLTNGYTYDDLPTKRRRIVYGLYIIGIALLLTGFMFLYVTYGALDAAETTQDLIDAIPLFELNVIWIVVGAAAFFSAIIVGYKWVEEIGKPPY